MRLLHAWMMAVMPCHTAGTAAAEENPDTRPREAQAAFEETALREGCSEASIQTSPGFWSGSVLIT